MVTIDLLLVERLLNLVITWFRRTMRTWRVRFTILLTLDEIMRMVTFCVVRLATRLQTSCPVFILIFCAGLLVRSRAGA